MEAFSSRSKSPALIGKTFSLCTRHGQCRWGVASAIALLAARYWSGVKYLSQQFRVKSFSNPMAK